MTYLYRVATAFDRFVNTLILGGSRDDTISQHAAKAAREGQRWACVLCTVLGFFAPNHCENSLTND